MLPGNIVLRILMIIFLTGLGLVFLPFTIGGILILFAYKRIPNVSLRYFIFFLIAVLALFIGSAWTVGLFSSSEKNVTKKSAVVITSIPTLIPTFSPTTTPNNPNLALVKVTRVIDGDTFDIEGGKRVRYIGIDTPETVDPRKEIQCFGKEAYLKDKELIEGNIVGLEKDVSETDKYGRLLRYVYKGDVFINQLLVSEGYARSSSYPPDIKYQDKFREAEKEARDNNRGLWNACSSVTSSPSQTVTLYPATSINTPSQSQTVTQAPAPINNTSSQYTCDCSKACPDISSCDEAQYLLNTCGCSARDGDHDGIACDGAPLHCQN